MPQTQSLTLHRTPSEIVFRTPPGRWEEGLFFGNGIQGGILSGHRTHERLILNRQGLWLPAADPKRVRQPVAHVLPEVRRLILAGHPDQAEVLWKRAAKDAGWMYVYSDPCHPAGEVRFTPEYGGLFQGWRRAVDCTRGVVRAWWTEADGASLERSAFSSRTDAVTVLRLGCDRPGRITGRLILQPVDPGAESIWLGTTFPGLDPEGWRGRTVPVKDLIRTVTTVESGGWHLRGDYTHGGGWGVVARLVVWGGSVTWDGTSVVLVGCDEVLVLSSVYVGDHGQAGPERSRLEAIAADHDTLLQRHAEAHAAQFDRCQLDLGGSQDGRSVEELILDAGDGPVPPALIEHLHAFGRYLLLACAGGEEPPHLQGIWSGVWRPPWFGNYTQDENVQMMHWAVEPGRLEACAQPLLAYFARQREDWARNARELFGCRGLLAPLLQSANDGRADCAEWHFFLSGTGWLAGHAWDRWLFSGDRQVLEHDCLPLLEGIAAFYVDFLIPLADGRLHCVPSLSIENHPLEWPARTSIDATIDIAVVREVLDRVIVASQTLDRNADLIPLWRSILDRLPAYRINELGGLAEWIPPQLKDNVHHRHISHLYPLFPGREIDAHRNPELFRAARIALDQRRVVGVRSQTSWSHIHLAHAYASTGSGVEASECLDVVIRACVMANLMISHDDRRGTGLAMGAIGGDGRWQLDASLGLTSLCYHLLVQSSEDSITILPALPPHWRTGRIGSVATRCRVDLTVAWDLDAGRCDLDLHPRNGAPESIRIEAGSGWSGVGVTRIPASGVRLTLRRAGVPVAR